MAEENTQPVMCSPSVIYNPSDGTEQYIIHHQIILTEWSHISFGKVSHVIINLEPSLKGSSLSRQKQQAEKLAVSFSKGIVKEVEKQNFSRQLVGPERT